MIHAYLFNQDASGSYWDINDWSVNVWPYRSRIGFVIQKGYSYSCFDANLNKELEINLEWIQAVLDAK